MPTVEPIVVTEPKTQTVPPLQRKDIFDIVNHGIVDGDIVLPEVEGGTKLYKHLLNLGADGGLTIITTKSDAITSYGQIASLKYVSVFHTNPDYIFKNISNYGSSVVVNFLNVHDLTSLAIKTFSFDSSSTISDTVTEL